MTERAQGAISGRKSSARLRKTVGKQRDHTRYLPARGAQGCYGLQAAATGRDEVLDHQVGCAHLQLAFDDILPPVFLGGTPDVDKRQI